MIGVAYVILRSAGKFGGAWFGSVISGAPAVIRNNLGLGLLSQAGVAIGLALDSSLRFSQLGEEGATFGQLIVNVITATTFIVQIIGPIGVKLAISRAGEIKQAVSAEDIWASEGTPK